MYSPDLAFVHDAGFADLAAGTAPEIVRILHRHGIRGGRVVEFGCGSGITARHLASHGYDVVGIDVSPAMIELARAKAPAGRFRAESIATATIPRCDAVIAVGEVVAYLPGGLPALRRVFARVHAALAPSGLLMFDFIESAAHRTYSAKTSGGPGWAIVSCATFERSRRILTRRMIVVRRVARRLRRSEEIHRVRVYRRGDVRAALARCGFTVRMSPSYDRYPLPSGDVAVVATRGAQRPTSLMMTA